MSARRILLASHGTAGARAADRAALEFCREPGAALYHLTVVPDLWLGMMGDEGRASRAEIAAVATDVERHVNAGVPANAARRFVDYWNHPGAFDALKPEAQTEIVRYIPKASLDFGALFNEPVSLEALRGLRIPLLMLRGENAPQPAALIAQKLASVMRAKAFVTVPGAGHMGPFSHADAVNRAIAQHIGGADLGTAQAQVNAAACAAAFCLIIMPRDSAGRRAAPRCARRAPRPRGRRRR